MTHVLLSGVLFSTTSALLPISRTLCTVATRGIATTSWILFSVNADSSDTTARDQMAEHCRKDGVRINHDPYAPGMAEKYGLPGQTDPEGFDPYADTVGPGIYGGSVQRDVNGIVVIGKQYQNHNHRPGPVYDRRGYSLMSRAIHAGPDQVKKILADFPELKEEVSTGGARPLHICGMSQKGQLSTQVFIDAQADVFAQDTYGYTALHRMASNNLAIGGEALVKAGHDPNLPMKGADSTPIEIAKRSRAIHFLMKMEELGYY
jgi:Ankyrin repeats (many copies)